MTHEWKVGDRFTLEFLVTHAGGYTDCETLAGALRAFPPSDMQHAKLIQPAATEPQKLDVTKPMELLDPGGAIPVVCKGVSSHGHIIVQFKDGTFDALSHTMLRNIPEPKITGRRVAVLLPDASVWWSDELPLNRYKDILGRALVEISDGDGWGGEA